MVERSADGIALFAPDGHVVYVSPRVGAIVGVPPEQLVDTSAFQWIEPEDHSVVAAAISELMSTGHATAEFRVRRPDRSVRWLSASGTNLFADPDVGALVANIRDITEQRRTSRERDELIESLTFERARLGTLFEHAPAFMCVLRGEDFVIELANEAYFAFVGGRREVLGHRLADAFPEIVAQGLLPLVEGVLKSGEPFFARGLEVHLGGRPLFVNVALQPLTEPDGTRSGVFINGVDVTEETQARNRIRAQFNGVPVPTYVWQRAPGDADDFVLVDFNCAAIELSRGAIERLRGKAAVEVFRDDRALLENVRRCLDTGEVFSREIERTVTGIDEKRRFVVTYAPAPPDSVIAHAEDITERWKLEDQLRQSQKMEAVGRLAGGVAHDFNNVLSVILSYASLLIDDLPRDHAMYDDLDEIRRAGERAVELTRQLLAFSRNQAREPRLLSVSDTLRDLEKMLKRLLGEDVELLFNTAATGLITADRGQIEQVIMNLVINARDAIPEGGTITLSTADVDVSSTIFTEPTNTEPGSYVTLEVTDTGSGMDEATRERIFEPFFTTKGPGKGTGLGLSTVFGIAQQTGATIAIDSEVGRGSTFCLYFPRVGTRGRASIALAAHRDVSGSETVLLVEDEEPLRNLATTILRRAGYDVLAAAHGEDALAVAEASGKNIHLLLTDVVMPRMGGRVLAEKLSAMRPEMRTLFMSGYTDDAEVLRRILESRASFIQKPITPETLLAKVREVLDAASEPAATRSDG
jgi:two-component system, cell cycle sensor histidine kinase and response regulator CckA